MRQNSGGSALGLQELHYFIKKILSQEEELLFIIL
jgi:hypothetical protein